MGEIDKEESIDALDHHSDSVDGADEFIDSIENVNDVHESSADSNLGMHLNSPDIDIPALAHEDEMSERQSFDYDPNSDGMKKMFRILSIIGCPLLDASYFEDSDLKKFLPSDRLGVSRIIMTTLNQCRNYWSTSTLTNLGSTRLTWASLNRQEFDSLISLISSHDGNRLSLMLSDLSLMKKLPIFETFAGNRVSIEERESNFTIDSSVDAGSITSYLPLSLQSKLLAEKPQFKDLYEDLNVQVLNEAKILQKFVIPEFPSMPLTQKEAVIKVRCGSINETMLILSFLSILTGIYDSSFLSFGIEYYREMGSSTPFRRSLEYIEGKFIRETKTARWTR